MSIHELLYKGKVLIETAKLNALGISTGAELTLRGTVSIFLKWINLFATSVKPTLTY